MGGTGKKKGPDFIQKASRRKEKVLFSQKKTLLPFLDKIKHMVVQKLKISVKYITQKLSMKIFTAKFFLLFIL